MTPKEKNLEMKAFLSDLEAVLEKHSQTLEVSVPPGVDRDFIEVNVYTYHCSVTLSGYVDADEVRRANEMLV